MESRVTGGFRAARTSRDQVNCRSARTLDRHGDFWKTTNCGHKSSKASFLKNKRSAEAEMSCDAPASGAVSGLSTLLLVTVNHVFYYCQKWCKLMPISRSRRSNGFCGAKTPLRPCIHVDSERANFSSASEISEPQPHGARPANREQQPGNDHNPVRTRHICAALGYFCGTLARSCCTFELLIRPGRCT